MVDFQVRLLLTSIESALECAPWLETHKTDDSIYVWHKGEDKPHYGYGIKFWKDGADEYVRFNVVPFLNENPDPNYKGKDWMVGNDKLKGVSGEKVAQIAVEVSKTLIAQMAYR